MDNLGPEEIAVVVQRLRDASTGIVRKLHKPVTTGKPTVQGIWDPSVTYDGFQLREGKVPQAKAPASAAPAGASSASSASSSPSASSAAPLA